MSVRIRLILAVLVGVSPAAQAATVALPTDGTAIASRRPAVSTAQLRAYSAVLVVVEKIRSSIATRAASLLPADSATLQSEADAQIQQELTSHDLDRSRFNAISAAVDKHPLLQRQVHQFVMEGLVGT
jgi:hypothetical protein